ncbi:tRNA guanosine(34) transglycosylase Tgt [Salinispira pacifica]|uniref:Queuine tRNA-ribosyltransferase n=1 Tax=Salinispira pacifica TaxID=1307761 RepID=V5WHT4_9SPIO|nr:tRNA guanosine(34) transglycosylase Tgt [Salinispira pacifica]AHC15180.1 tRNA-guanine transglycosylase [Salinispira pacifica]
MIYRKLHKDQHCEARTGQIHLPHGNVDTPVFMPVGTNASVKAVRLEDLFSMGVQLILGNTYHLYLRPGMDVIQKFGGLHGFNNWNGNILTDSGGYQVFSLAPFRKVTNEGVEFRSHIDGSKHFLTPEKVVGIQEILNSDIQMVLDVCTEPGISHKSAREALEITTSWALRAKNSWETTTETYQGKLFGIVQGNFYEDLRARSAEELSALDLPGYAIGGLSVGEPFDQFQHYLAFTAPLLPGGKPRYLMGVGTPEYILEAIEHGIDMFDCVFPTRVARNGTLFTDHGRLVLKNQRYEYDTRPVSEHSPTAAYSRSYLRHLFKAGEMLGPMLASLHNLWFLKKLVEDSRRAIHENRFLEFKRSFLDLYSMGIPD